MQMYYDQSAYDVRLEWGMGAITHLVSSAEAIVIVDVLSFTTCLDVATANGAQVYPYRYRDASASDYARSLNAELAQSRLQADCKYSLSPQSLRNLPAGARLVLPSPNGSMLSLGTGSKQTFAACLRNAAAVAAQVQKISGSVLVVPAGERWRDDTLRVAAEDFIGAGAVIANLRGAISPEADLALASFEKARHDLPAFISNTASGRELIERGFHQDVCIAAELNVSDAVPMLRDDAFVNAHE